MKEIKQIMLSDFIHELQQILKTGDKYIGFSDSQKSYTSECTLITTEEGDLVISINK